MADYPHSNRDYFCYSPCLLEVNYHRQLTSSPMMVTWPHECSNFFFNFVAGLATNFELTCAEGSLASTYPSGQQLPIQLQIFH